MDAKLKKRDSLRKWVRQKVDALLRLCDKPDGPRQTSLTRAINEFDVKMAKYAEIQAVVESLTAEDTFDVEILR